MNCTRSRTIFAFCFVGSVLCVPSCLLFAQPSIEELFCLASKEQPTDPRWREMCFEGFEKLENVPIAQPLKSLIPRATVVSVRNPGTTALEYIAEGGSEKISVYQEVAAGDGWSAQLFPWCGVGKKLYEIPPGKTVNLVVYFRSQKQRERLLGRFTEKGSKKSGLIVLAKEPKN